MKIAILDDYQNVALKMADWSAVSKKADIVEFNDHVASPEAVIRRLYPFDVVCVMRERTPLTSDIIQRLPNLKLIASTAGRNASIDMSAADFIICMCELISDRHSFSHDDLLNISSDRSQ